MLCDKLKQLTIKYKYKLYKVLNVLQGCLSDCGLNCEFNVFNGGVSCIEETQHMTAQFSWSACIVMNNCERSSVDKYPIQKRDCG